MRQGQRLRSRPIEYDSSGFFRILILGRLNLRRHLRWKYPSVEQGVQLIADGWVRMDTVSLVLGRGVDRAQSVTFGRDLRLVKGDETAITVHGATTINTHDGGMGVANCNVSH